MTKKAMADASSRIFTNSMQELLQRTYGNCSKLLQLHMGHPQTKLPLLMNEVQRFNAGMKEFHSRFQHQTQTMPLEKQLYPKLSFLKLSVFGYQLGFYTTETMKLACLNPPKKERTSFVAGIPIHQSILLQNQLVNMFFMIQNFYKFELLGQHPEEYEEILQFYKNITSQIDPLFENTLLSSFCVGVNVFDLLFRYSETLYAEGIYSDSEKSIRRCIEESANASEKCYKTHQQVWRFKVMESMCLYRLGQLHARKIGELDKLSKELLQDNPALKYWFDTAKKCMPQETLDEISNSDPSVIPGYHQLLYMELKKGLDKLVS
ncbi:hypothetical protein FDP41_004253 [Naegleria fowleri]|uniref:Uncharacterized protein n=1 Tax=Naegleria fowleri TaxID=5763 RepID=A0A6A5BS80_NAEFO|nr:uncharacterized protein FDP41_004253 [Naegleria fowleri]KAF0976958.1 hypothetical protein FDP41_004253 [Naegleria fowleri]CAG4716018.1 unnamed protein product [Naegleria fowleri]